jgi:hypothetical protein
VIDVYVERFEEDDEQSSVSFLIEPNEKFAGAEHLVMATTLVDINIAPTCKLRIMNPFDDEAVLRQYAEIGRAEGIEKVVSVSAEEDASDIDNLCQVRRVQLMNAVTSEQEANVGDASQLPPNLQELFKSAMEDKPRHHKEAIAGLFMKHSATFSKDDWDIRLTHLTEHTIDKGTAAPIKKRPRRVPLAWADAEKAVIEDLLRKGVIRQRTSPWASPIVLVRKNSGAVRPCVDYRKLNALVKPDDFPLS